MKKVLSLTTIIICLIMCSINFATGFNADNYQNETIYGENDLSNMIRNANVISAYSIDNTIEDMDTVKFGSYRQDNSEILKPIEWIVLEKEGNKALLLSKYSLVNKQYYQSSSDVTWEECTLRMWLNDRFYTEAFNNEEQSIILSASVVNKDNTQYHSKGGKSTEDKIYILSEEEVIKYFGCKSNETYGYQLGKNAGTKPTIYSMTSKDNVYSNSSMNDELSNTYYWLRTPGYRNKNALTVDYENVLNTYGMYVNEELGVRPVMWVSY